MTKKVGMIVILLMGLGAAKLIYSGLAQKTPDDLAKKSSLVSVSSSETSDTMSIKDTQINNSSSPAQKKPDAASNQASQIDPNTQDEIITSSDPSAVAENDSEPKSVSANKEESVLPKDRKEELKPVNVREGIGGNAQHFTFYEIYLAWRKCSCRV